MIDQQIDGLLGAEEEFAPSSGFADRVMQRLREEASAPPPIPFPWKRAVPGFVLAVALFGWTGVEFARRIPSVTGNLTIPSFHMAPYPLRSLEEAGWVLAALAVSAASWMLSRRLAR